MKKASIVTLNGYFNYGNRLQNYALQEALKKYNLEVDTLRINRTPKKETVKPLLRNIRDYINSSSKYKLEKKREEIFTEFSHTYINEQSEEYFLDDDLSFLNAQTDFFVAGSDQVWNPNMNKLSSKYFLGFAAEDKRIAYSPSFGVQELSTNVAEKYEKWIDGIPFLSVREHEGAELINQLTNRHAEVLVDPTMLLTRKEWLKITKKADNKPKGNYILTYFLGGIPEQHQEEIYNLSKRYSMPVINLGDISEEETYKTGPSEFIDYINDSSVFFTDSFHGVVFSILLDTPFVVYERITSTGTMYSRIETILDKFDLREREVENVVFTDRIFTIDYSHALSVLEKEKQQADEFLKQALGLADN